MVDKPSQAGIDPFEAMDRVREDFRELDQRRFHVIVADIGIEREVDRILRTLDPAPPDLDELEYNDRLKVLKVRSPHIFGVEVLEAAIAFHRLRNSAAHGHDNKKFEARAATVRGLVGHFTGVRITRSAHFGTIGMGIVGALHVSFEDRA